MVDCQSWVKKLQRAQWTFTKENDKHFERRKICDTHNSSSQKERKENALAPEAEEGRDKLRKATGSCK